MAEEVIPRKVRFLAIDPGSRTLGLAVLEYNFETGELTVLFTRCLDVDEGLKHIRYLEVLQGISRARRWLVKHFLKHQIEDWQPAFVIMETPYMGSFSQVFKILVEIMEVIEGVVSWFGNAIALLKIDPSTVKKSVGVKGNSSDKDLMRDAVKGIKYLVLREGVDLDHITEHEIDAIAVGNYYVVEELKDAG